MAVTGRGAFPLHSQRFARARLTRDVSFGTAYDDGAAALRDYFFAEAASDAATALPAAAKIAELRLAISAPTDDAERPLTRQAPYAAAYRELWRGEMMFAPQTRADTRALAATLESLDGRVTAFKVELAAGVFSQSSSHTGTLASVPSLGADTISLNLNPASGTLEAGTLVAVGEIDTPTYQLFEVLEDVTASGATSAKVAPRVRQQFSIGSTVAIGTVNAKLRLAGDELDVSDLLSHGLVVASVVEAL